MVYRRVGRYAFFLDVDEEKVVATAQEIVNSGLRDAGYTYVNLVRCMLLGLHARHGPLTECMVAFAIQRMVAG